MIHYHGGPVTPYTAGLALWKGRHAMVSFAHPEQIALAAEICQSFSIDNGAYSMWRSGIIPDWEKYYTFLEVWGKHPGCDFAIIPDVIDGTEEQNDELIDHWFSKFDYTLGTPVWHLHESLKRLERLTRFPRIALGSSGQYATVGTTVWWARMSKAMMILCDEDGYPFTKLHGLRMLNPTIFSHLPLSSADSTNVARNIGIDKAWKSLPYSPSSKDVRAMVLAERIESHAQLVGGQEKQLGYKQMMNCLGSKCHIPRFLPKPVTYYVYTSIKQEGPKYRTYITSGAALR